MARKEIVINTENEQTRIAIVENGELAELLFESPENSRTLGDVYLAKVRRVMPNIQAAFVDIGQKQDAFLHFSDLAENFPDSLRLLEQDPPVVGSFELQTRTSNIIRTGKRAGRGLGEGDIETDEDDEDITFTIDMDGDDDDDEQDGSIKVSEVSLEDKAAAVEENVEPPEPLENYLKRDQELLVKIIKEPISQKGSRVSTDISLAGRFLVLVPLADYVAVSKKIHSYRERRRLRTLAKSLLPEGFGVIVRTVAAGKNAKTLDTDLRLLIEKWHAIEARLKERPQAPACLHQDVNMASSVIRDLFSEDFDRILVDDPRLYKSIKGYVSAVAPQLVPNVVLHEGKSSVFRVARVEKQVLQAFEQRVDMQSGAYLIIERTEAMHVVDVNSGRAGRGLSQEDNSLRVNLEAARMIAKQVRLRDLGGIICIDFIDLKDEKNQKKVYDELKKEFRLDRAVTKVLPMSDFGIIQITRQRLRPSVTTQFEAPEQLVKEVAEIEAEEAKNRGSEGDGAPRLTPAEMMEKLDRWVNKYKDLGYRKPLIIKLHPFAAAWMSGKAWIPLSWRLRLKYGIGISIATEEKLHALNFRIIEAESDKDITFRVWRGRRPGNNRGKRRKNGGRNHRRENRNPSKEAA